MTRRQELIEAVTKYLNDPTFGISSVNLTVEDKVLYVNLDRSVYALTGRVFDGYLIEDTPIYGGGMGLERILESMRPEENSER